jgi:hypothetical protein
MFLIILGVIIFMVWSYILFIRVWMLSKWPDQVGWWHTIEDNLWAKSRTILGARLYWVSGAIIALHDLAAAAGIDVTPITTQLSEFIAPEYRGLALSAGLAATGILFEYLRRVTTVPVADIGAKN